jgi:hypothetical protein
LSDYYVILDTNVWVTERLLQSNVGSALLHALTETNARIGVPEVVETEVKNVLLDLADGAVAAITKNNSLLQQLSGQKLTYMAPTASAIKEGIEGRWKQLEGALTRIPFTFEQAKAALDRVMKKLPPSGPNNEQFRDCCIWETALSLASERTVHLITKDSAFYQGRTSSNGLASVLTQELANLRRDVRIYPNLEDFLTAMNKSVKITDEISIRKAIVGAVASGAARDIAFRTEFGDTEGFALGEASQPHISGYAIPQSSLLAILFEISFDLKRVAGRGDGEEYRDAKLTLKGVCSYDPNSKEISGVEIREWQKELGPRRIIGWADAGYLETQYSPSRMRLIP